MADAILSDSTNDALTATIDVDTTLDLTLHVIRERLTQANATLDLLFSLSSVKDGASIKDLREDTLSSAIDNCMRYIDEAVEATNRAIVEAIHSRRPPLANREATTVQ
jgi:hypothetical protein